MRLVGLRVHTPHALSPLPIDDAVLLFTRKSERQPTGKVWGAEEEWEGEGQGEEQSNKDNKRGGRERKMMVIREESRNKSKQKKK